MGLLDLVKEAYADVAPIIAEGSQLFHYKIPGDSEIKALQAESQNLNKAINTLKGYTSQLLKTADPSVKAQQDQLRTDAANIQSQAQDAQKMLQAAISGVQQIQAKTRAGQDVSIDDTSQILSLKQQADELYNESINNINSSIDNIKTFFANVVVKPSQPGLAGVAQAVIGTVKDATRTGATGLENVGQGALQIGQGAAAGASKTAALIEYLPYIVGGAILIGGVMYITSLPKPRSGFSFGD